VYIAVVDDESTTEGVPDMKQVSTMVTERLGQAIANFDADGINGVEADDRVASILEHVLQAKVGLITGNELLAKLEQDTGEKFGTDADLGISLDPQHGSPLSKAQVPTEQRVCFSSAGATRQR